MVSQLLEDVVEETAGTSWGRYPEVAGSSLQRLIPGAVVMFVSEHASFASRRRFSVAGESVPPWRPKVLGDVASEHPMIRSYNAHGASFLPRRMSDILSQRAFERTRTFQQLFRPHGMRYQMTILTRNLRAGRGRSWVLNRPDRDFTDAELDTARRLQDLLVLLDNAAECLAAYSGVPGCGGAQPGLAGIMLQDRDSQDTSAVENVMRPSFGPSERPGLTDREVQVLSLLADGLTAAGIGRVLGISPRTVSKHLEHVYAKLGSRDRLLAVRRATALGLLPR